MLNLPRLCGLIIEVVEMVQSNRVIYTISGNSMICYCLVSFLSMMLIVEFDFGVSTKCGEIRFAICKQHRVHSISLVSLRLKVDVENPYLSKKNSAAFK